MNINFRKINNFIVKDLTSTSQGWVVCINAIVYWSVGIFDLFFKFLEANGLPTVLCFFWPLLVYLNFLRDLKKLNNTAIERNIKTTWSLILSVFPVIFFYFYLPLFKHGA